MYLCKFGIFPRNLQKIQWKPDEYFHTNLLCALKIDSCVCSTTTGLLKLQQARVLLRLLSLSLFSPVWTETKQLQGKLQHSKLLRLTQRRPANQDRESQWFFIFSCGKENILVKTELIGDQFSSEWCDFSTTVTLFNQVIMTKLSQKSCLVSLQNPCEHVSVTAVLPSRISSVMFTPQLDPMLWAFCSCRQFLWRLWPKTQTASICRRKWERKQESMSTRGSRGLCLYDTSLVFKLLKVLLQHKSAFTHTHTCTRAVLKHQYNNTSQYLFLWYLHHVVMYSKCPGQNPVLQLTHWGQVTSLQRANLLTRSHKLIFTHQRHSHCKWAFSISPKDTLTCGPLIGRRPALPTEPQPPQKTKAQVQSVQHWKDEHVPTVRPVICWLPAHLFVACQVNRKKVPYILSINKLILPLRLRTETRTAVQRNRLNCAQTFWVTQNRKSELVGKEADTSISS